MKIPPKKWKIPEKPETFVKSIKNVRQKVACTVDRVGVGEHFDVIRRYFGAGPTRARRLYCDSLTQVCCDYR